MLQEKRRHVLPEQAAGLGVLGAALCLAMASAAPAQQDWRKAAGPVRIYNTAK